MGQGAKPQRCPQCAAALGAPTDSSQDAAVYVCQYCETVSVARHDSLSVAGRDLSHGEHAVDWLHALCCRLCGGALPKAVTADPKAVCSYCGHTARLKPGVVAALRLVFTKPKLAPPVLRRTAWFVAATWLTAIAITTVGLIRFDGHVQPYFETELDLAEIAPGSVVVDEVVDIGPLTKNLLLEAKPTTKGDKRHVALRVDRRHFPSDTCGSDSDNMRWTARIWDKHRLRDNPRGSTRFVVTITANSDPPPIIDLRLVGYAPFPLGYMIFLLNVLLWLSFYMSVKGAEFTATKRGGARTARLVVFLFLIGWGVFVGFGLDPFATRSIGDQHATPCSELPTLAL